MRFATPSRQTSPDARCHECDSGCPWASIARHEGSVSRPGRAGGTRRRAPRGPQAAGGIGMKALATAVTLPAAGHPGSVRRLLALAAGDRAAGCSAAVRTRTP
jgi:hypothetical protein